MHAQISKELVDRFFRYAAISSQSDPTARDVPSTPGQRALAELLARELGELGLEDVHIGAHGILTARRPGSNKAAASVGFVAHLDTVDVGLAPDVKPQVLRFDGQDLCLNAAQDIWLRVAAHPEIAPYQGQEILFSDGTSVLGADNKAAIAVIMTLMRHLNDTRAACGDICLAFVPDEETGLKGAKLMDLARFPVDFAYTIDCCELGEVVYETFNAATVTVNITGVTAHPMSAKGVLVNPIRVAHDFIGCFGTLDTPEHTEKRQGYFWVTDMTANASRAELKMSIRDFDKAAYEARKQYVHDAIRLMQTRHPKAVITCRVDDVYSNISNNIEGRGQRPIDLIFTGMARLGITPKVIPMRGGTDGSALSARGIVTPNYFTGAHNFHSCYEFLPVPSFVQSFMLTATICELVHAEAREGDE